MADAQDLIDESPTIPQGKKTRENVTRATITIKPNYARRQGYLKLKSRASEFSQKKIPIVENENVRKVYRNITHRSFKPVRRGIQSVPMVPRSSAGYITRTIANRNLPGQASKGYSGRGRPKGTVKYYIPGVGPSGVFEYRKYVRFKQRQLAMQMQAQNPQLAYAQARQSVGNIPIQTSQPRQIMQPQASIQPMNPYEIQPQQVPVPIPADGWSLLKIKSPFSLTSYNQPLDPVANAQRPVGNKYTDYYSEPDFLSGQQVMKRRPNVGGFGLW